MRIKRVSESKEVFSNPQKTHKLDAHEIGVAPVALEFKRIKQSHKKLGIEKLGKSEYAIINLAETKGGLNIPRNQPAM